MSRCAKNRGKRPREVFGGMSVSLRSAAKSSPLKFFAVFLATARNFNLEFCKFIDQDVLHLTAKWNVILLINDKFIDFSTWLTTDFVALKMFKLKRLFNIQKRVTSTRCCRWRHSDVLINSNLFCLYIITNLKQSLAAHRILLPAKRRISTHSAQRTELAAGQLSRFHHKGRVASKFAKYHFSIKSHFTQHLAGHLSK